MKEAAKTTSQTQKVENAMPQAKEGLELSAPSISPFIQTALKIGAPDDPFEKEADAIADQVVQRAEVPHVQACCSCKHEEELRRKALPGISAVHQTAVGGGQEAPGSFAKGLHNDSAGGSSLPDRTKGEMESAFGRDFSQVRVHTDQNSARLNDQVQAKAFTHGSDIYFNQGQFQPDTKAGKHLLAHELTHVIQQKNTSQTVQREGGETSETLPTIREILNEGSYQGAVDSYLRLGELEENEEFFDDAFALLVGGINGVSMYTSGGALIGNGNIPITFPVISGIYRVRAREEGNQYIYQFSLVSVSPMRENPLNTAALDGSRLEHVFVLPVDMEVMELEHRHMVEATGLNTIYAIILNQRIVDFTSDEEEPVQGRAAEGEEGQAPRRGRASVPPWAWTLFHQVKEEIDEQRSAPTEAGSSCPRLPGYMTILPGDPNASTAQFLIWLNNAQQLNREQRRSEPRSSMRVEEGDSVEEVIQEVCEVTSRLVSQRVEEAQAGSAQSGSNPRGQVPITEDRFLERSEGGTQVTAPSFPARLTGPEEVVPNATASYSMILDYSIADPTLLGQVAEAFVSRVDYDWEIWDVTQLMHRFQAERTAQLEAAQNELAENQDAESSETVVPETTPAQEEIEAITQAPASAEREVTNADVSQRRVERRHDNFEEDVDNLFYDLSHPFEASDGTTLDAFGNFLTNVFNVGTLGLHSLFHAVATLWDSIPSMTGAYDFSQEIPFPDRPGFFLIRCIARPQPHHDVVRFPSVETMVVQTRPIGERVSRELRSYEANLAASIGIQELALEHTEEDAERTSIQGQLRELRAQQRGDVVTFLEARLANMNRQIEAERNPYKRRDLERKRDAINDRLETARANINDRPNSTLLPIRAMFINEEDGSAYPLVLQLFQNPEIMLRDMASYRLADITTPSGEQASGYGTGGDKHEEAINNVFEQYAGAFPYGRGRLLVKFLGESPGESQEYSFRCTPRGEGQASERFQELLTALSILALAVPGLGQVAGAAAAAYAVARMIHRFDNNTLRWDSNTVDDLINILGGIASGVSAMATARVQRTGRFFAIAGMDANMARILQGMQRTARIAEFVDQFFQWGGLLIGNMELIRQYLDIQRRVASGELTPGEARRHFVDLIRGGLMNNGLHFAGFARSLAADAPRPNRSEPESIPQLPERRPAVESPRDSQGPSAEEAPLPRMRPQSPGDERSPSQEREQRSGDDPNPERRPDADDDGILEMSPEEEAAFFEGVPGIPENPRNREQSYDMYLRWIDTMLSIGNPGAQREVGLYFNPITGEYFVVQGDGHSVFVETEDGGLGIRQEAVEAGRNQSFTELLGHDIGHWVLLDHFHPSDHATGFVSPSDRLPSGANGDFGVIIFDSIDSGLVRRSSTIRFQTNRGLEHTTFTYDPHAARPFIIDYPDVSTGERTTIDFPSLEAYHEWMETQFGVDLGPVPATLTNALPSSPGGGDAERIRQGESSRVEELHDLQQQERFEQLRQEAGEDVELLNDRPWLILGSESRYAPPNPRRFAFLNVGFTRILRAIRSARRRLNSNEQSTMLTEPNESVLNMLSVQLVFQSEALYGQFSDILLQLHTLAHGDRQALVRMGGWQELSSFLGQDPQSLLVYLDAALRGDSFETVSRSRQRGSGGSSTEGIRLPGEVRRRRPDFVEFDLEAGRIGVVDVTLRDDPIHRFKTRFYVEVLRQLLPGTSLSIEGLERILRLDMEAAQQGNIQIDPERSRDRAIED